MSKKGKLHELLAVEGDKAQIAKHVLEEGTHVFNKKIEFFVGHNKNLEYFDENRNENEGGVVDQREITTTVREKLSYIFEQVSVYYDVVLQKELTNRNAESDLEIDGIVFGVDLPATFLLGLEAKLCKVRELVKQIPTLLPGISWKEDKTLGKGVYRKTTPDITYKTEKTIKPFELSPATKEHKAQVEKLSVDVNIGKYTNEIWASMLTVAEKSAMLQRVDNLISAVKKARQRANDCEIVDAHIGKKIMDYILG